MKSGSWPCFACLLPLGGTVLGAPAKLSGLICCKVLSCSTRCVSKVAAQWPHRGCEFVTNCFRRSPMNTYRIAASPKLLLNVCITQRFPYFSTRETALEPSVEKSMYASSTTTTPLNDGSSKIVIIVESGTSVPVGFPGEQKKMSLTASFDCVAFRIFANTFKIALMEIQV